MIFINSLNPCCNGIYLIIWFGLRKFALGYVSLNPCCNGIYLIIKRIFKKFEKYYVLILVVMEYT